MRPDEIQDLGLRRIYENEQSREEQRKKLYHIKDEEED